MDLFDIAEENFIISFSIVAGIGILQGGILGRGIRRKFPSLKVHAKLVSLVLLGLFSINAVANIMKFAIPEKFVLNEIEMPTSGEESLWFIINFVGLDAGFGTAMAVFVSITLFLFFRFAELPRVARYFIFSISVILFLVAISGRYSDFIPSSFQVLLYAFYQVGLTLGIFLVTRRKESKVLSELK